MCLFYRKYYIYASVFMYLHAFSQRLRILREIHGLSLSDMASILCINSKVNVNRWELEKNWPSTDVLINLSNKFGVTLDWLIGRSNKPYDLQVLEHIEHNLLLETFDYNDEKIYLVRDFEWMTEEYRDPSLREKNYSSVVRANIIFLFQQYLAYKKKELDYKQKISESSVLVVAIMEKKRDLETKYPTEENKKEIKLFKHYQESLKLLLLNKTSARAIYYLGV